MTFQPTLDTKLALCCLRVTLPGDWQLQDPGATWDDFKVGRTEAIRAIRHRGEKLWVTARMVEVDNFAKMVAYGAQANLEREFFTHFNLYTSDPREGKPKYGFALGGVGVVTRIQEVLALRAR